MEEDSRKAIRLDSNCVKVNDVRLCFEIIRGVEFGVLHLVCSLSNFKGIGLAVELLSIGCLSWRNLGR